MATDSDVFQTKCGHGLTLPSPVLERPAVRVQINGSGGVWPAAKLLANDTVEMAFRKNGGAWQILPRQYEVKQGAVNGNTLVLYMVLKLEEVNFGQS